MSWKKFKEWLFGEDEIPGEIFITDEDIEAGQITEEEAAAGQFSDYEISELIRETGSDDPFGLKDSEEIDNQNPESPSIEM